MEKKCISPFGHKFEARYDEEPPKMDFSGGRSADWERLIRAMTKRTYVRDVCVRCGMTIERGEEK